MDGQRRARGRLGRCRRRSRWAPAPAAPIFRRCVPTWRRSSATVDTSSQAFKDFVANVEPLLTKSCAFGTCHSGERVGLLPHLQGRRPATPPSSTSSRRRRSSPRRRRPRSSCSSRSRRRPAASPTPAACSSNRRTTTAWKNLLAWATEAGALAARDHALRRREVLRRLRDAGLLEARLRARRRATRRARQRLQAARRRRGFISRFSLHDNYASRGAATSSCPTCPTCGRAGWSKSRSSRWQEGGFGLVASRRAAASDRRAR